MGNCFRKWSRFNYIPFKQQSNPSEYEDGCLKKTSIHDKYILGVQVGKGNFGTVHRCIDRGTQEMFACKTILKDAQWTEQQLDDVKQEVRTMHRLSLQPSIVSLKEAYESENSIQIVMELCEGGDLFDLISRYVVPEQEVVKIFPMVIEAVKACHGHKIIHRDIKPENFLITKEGNLKLTDFGFAVFFKPGQRFTERVGTLCYLAPEIFDGNYGPEADIWSAGVTLYFMLCGFLPFEGTLYSDVKHKVLFGNLDFERAPWPHISQDAKQLVRGMLHMQPDLRLTASQILEHPWLQNDV